MLDIDMDSIVSQLKNKVSYRLKQSIEDAVHDPEANDYAKQKEESESSTGTVEALDEIPGILSAAGIRGNASSNDIPNNLSSMEKMVEKMKKIGYRIKDRMIDTFSTFIIPLILAMFVANESVMYPVPVRIVYFVFTFVMCYVNRVALILLGTIYLGKFAYDYYVNKMEKRGIKLIVPPILSILPIKVFDPSEERSFFKDLFNYPITYPKNERGGNDLLLIMNRYLESLKESFTYLDNVKAMPMFVEKLQKIDENMEKLHKPPVPESIQTKENNGSPAPLPLTIAEQREKNGLPALNASESNQKNANRPLPPTISEQIQNNRLSSVNASESNQKNANPPLPPTISEKKTTSNADESSPPNYNGKEKKEPAPVVNERNQPPAYHNIPPPNYNEKNQPPPYNNTAPVLTNNPVFNKRKPLPHVNT